MRTKIILLLFTVLAMTNCEKKTIQQPPQGVEVRQVNAMNGSGPGGLRFSAALQPDSQVMLSFRIAGYVTSIMQIRGEDGRTRTIDEGDHVNKGDVLVRIRPTEYEDKVDQVTHVVEVAEAEARRAKLDYDRATRLYETQSMTKPKYDEAVSQYEGTQAKVKAALAEVSEAKIALKDTMLVAPFSGEIVSKTVEVGSFMAPTLPAIAMTNTDSVKLIIGVPDVIVHSMKVNQPVGVSIDAFPNRGFNAHISRISSAADPRARNFDVEVSLPNTDHSLKVGMIASLQLLGSGQRQHSAVLLPLSAIVQAPDGKYGVFLVAKSNAGESAKLRRVEVGEVEGSEINITSGLTAGETVITSGATLIKDGDRVEVIR